MKKVLDFCSNSKESFNASNKAREDINKTFEKNGYHVVNVGVDYSLSKVGRYMKRCFKVIKEIMVNKKNHEELYIQYPTYLNNHFNRLILWLLQIAHPIYLVHDINSLRRNCQVSKDEVKILNYASKLIVHTDSMKNHLLKSGVTVPMTPLWLFDYYSSENKTVNTKHMDKNIIAFAGNLNKSKFLKSIPEIFTPCKIYVYGVQPDFDLPSCIIYKGRFKPDEIHNVEGGWGLVWDGDSIATCEGNMGNYLKYNSSHKNSLYLACGKPLIVWKHSSLSDFVLENKIGMAVESISEIPHIISKMSDYKYYEYVKHVQSFQSKILNGEFLKNVL